jgi:hypothetical protein
MQNMDNSNPNSNDLDTYDEGFEIEATKVEVGDNFVVIFDELENDDPFYVILCDHALHECKATFDNDQGSTWYACEMPLRGVWYHHVLSEQGRNTSYRLLHDAFPTFGYSHLILKFKFVMLLVTTREGNPRFSMPLEVKESLLTTIEEQQHYGEL